MFLMCLCFSTDQSNLSDYCETLTAIEPVNHVFICQVCSSKETLSSKRSVMYRCKHYSFKQEGPEFKSKFDLQAGILFGISSSHDPRIYILEYLRCLCWVCDVACPLAIQHGAEGIGNIKEYFSMY